MVGFYARGLPRVPAPGRHHRVWYPYRDPNINSLRSVEQAVRFEMMRQAQVLDDGGVIDQETRHYQETTVLRQGSPEGNRG